MAESSFDLKKLLAGAGIALDAEKAQRRAQLLRHLERAIREQLQVQGPFNAVEYPSANIGTGRLLAKPGEKLFRHVWGTVMSRTEPWEPGTEDDIGFHIGRDLVLVVSDRDDTPPERACFIVHVNGYVEHLNEPDSHVSFGTKSEDT